MSILGSDDWIKIKLNKRENFFVRVENFAIQFYCQESLLENSSSSRKTVKAKLVCFRDLKSKSSRVINGIFLLTKYYDQMIIISRPNEHIIISQMWQTLYSHNSDPFVWPYNLSLVWPYTHPNVRCACCDTVLFSRIEKSIMLAFGIVANFPVVITKYKNKNSRSINVYYDKCMAVLKLRLNIFRRNVLLFELERKNLKVRDALEKPIYRSWGDFATSDRRFNLPIV